MSTPEFPTQPVLPCTFCGAAATAPLRLPRSGAASCMDCAGRVGRLLSASPEELVRAWPVLAVGEDEALDPEPRVRRADGSVRELREVTAELKRELPPHARAQLAAAYGEMGMPREQVQECAHLLETTTDPALLQHALDLLFSERLCAPGAVELVRSRLFPS